MQTSKTFPRSYIILLLFLVGCVALLIGLGIGYLVNPNNGKNLPPPAPIALNQFTLLLSQPVPVSNVSLTTHYEGKFTSNNFNQHWTFLFFGYTYCPDICPVTLNVLNQVYKLLEDKEGVLSNTQFIFVSVDPERDNTTQLGEYLSYFNRKFIGVTGNKDQIKALSQPLGIAYYRVLNESGYLINHSASILLIDPLGRLRANFLPPHTPSDIAEDFLKIREFYAEECCALPGPPKRTFIKGRETL